MENEKKEIPFSGIELVISEGEVLEPGTSKGEIMNDVQEQDEKQTDKELLEIINKKLDILLAAQNSS